jgi:hypothetical protein
MEKTEQDKSGVIIGGGLLLGLGVGFFLLEYSPLFFLGSILAGLGLGLILSTLVKNK